MARKTMHDLLRSAKEATKLRPVHPDVIASPGKSSDEQELDAKLNFAELAKPASDQSTVAVHQSGPPETSTGTVQQSTPPKMHRVKALSISQERIDLTWPHLAATGFGPHQLTQIESNLIETGQATDRVLPSLHHAEWELEHGKMLDKAGQPVTDPCAWVFMSLARTGYYRRPPSYVSAEEQAAKDKEETARAVSFWRQKADAARFEAWRGGLSPSEKEHILEGFPDLREVWLKAYWKKFIY
uniref:Uncharacterized protein n=1 Tax=Desulfovibrio sp. U5L TaxID=596152 RepID=I2PZY8_9BACT